MEYCNFRKSLTKCPWDVIAICFILWGIFALLTPLTPGSWLLLVGLFVILGRGKTENLVMKVIGKKWFNKFGIEKMLRKIDKTNHHGT